MCYSLTRREEMNLYSIGQFAKLIGKTTQTLRDWDKKGVLTPEYITSGKHRMYSEKQLREVLQFSNGKKRFNVGYTRVSSKKQENDLTRQYNLMEIFLAKQGKEYQIIKDIGSEINYKRKGLLELLRLISLNQIDTIFILHKDRLFRFCFELIEEFAKLHNTKIIIINKQENQTDEDSLVKDILSIITVFSARLNGKKSHKNKKIIEELNKWLEVLN